MFSIYDGRDTFYQWDLDRKVIVNDESISQVHFCNRTDNCSLVVETYKEDGLTLANVPNILLQNNWQINVYAYDGKATRHSAVFKVIGRTKPADYIYEETPIINLEVLENKITEGLTAIDNKTEESLKVIEEEYQENNANYVNVFANALKGSAEGGIVRLDDVSPIARNMKIKVSGVEDMSAVKLNVYGKNLIDDEAIFKANGFTKLEDGRWLGKNTKYTLFKNDGLVSGRFSYSLNFQRTDTSIGAGVMVIMINYTDGYTDYRNSSNGFMKYTSIKDKDLKSITVSYNTIGTFYISNFQVEYGETNTEYEPYRCESFTPNEDGSVDGVVGNDDITLTTNTEGASISVEYNKDTNAVIEKLTNAIISLGGNV